MSHLSIDGICNECATIFACCTPHICLCVDVIIEIPLRPNYSSKRTSKRCFYVGGGVVEIVRYLKRSNGCLTGMAVNGLVGTHFLIF